PRPGPAPDDRLETPEARLVDLDEHDVAVGVLGSGGASRPDVVQRQVDGSDERRRAGEDGQKAGSQPDQGTRAQTDRHETRQPRETGLTAAFKEGRRPRERGRNGSGTGIRTPVPWLRTTCPNP